jgi:hypothetical protein
MSFVHGTNASFGEHLDDYESGYSAALVGVEERDVDAGDETRFLNECVVSQDKTTLKSILFGRPLFEYGMLFLGKIFGFGMVGLGERHGFDRV